jgi:hypothetical protein
MKHDPLQVTWYCTSGVTKLVGERKIAFKRGAQFI